MNVDEAIHARRTAHRYRPDVPLPPGALDDALAAANAAPCHRHTWPWRFTVVGDSLRKQLADIGVAAKQAKRALSDEQQAAVRAKLSDPPCLVVVSQVLAEDLAVREEDYAATACAIQNLCLSLTGRKVHTKWSTGGVTKHPDTYALLGIDAAEERIVGFVWAGKAATELPEVRRPPLEDVVRHVG